MIPLLLSLSLAAPADDDASAALALASASAKPAAPLTHCYCYPLGPKSVCECAPGKCECSHGDTCPLTWKDGECNCYNRLDDPCVCPNGSCTCRYGKSCDKPRLEKRLEPSDRPAGDGWQFDPKRKGKATQDGWKETGWYRTGAAPFLLPSGGVMAGWGAATTERVAAPVFYCPPGARG